MSDKNIDKDIEILKNLIKYLQGKIDAGIHKIVYNNDFHEEKTVDCINAIENVLSELEIKDKMIDKMAEEYSKYQLRRSYMGEITETAYGIKSRIRNEVLKNENGNDKTSN